MTFGFGNSFEAVNNTNETLTVTSEHIAEVRGNLDTDLESVSDSDIEAAILEEATKNNDTIDSSVIKKAVMTVGFVAALGSPALGNAFNNTSIDYSPPTISAMDERPQLNPDEVISFTKASSLEVKDSTIERSFDLTQSFELGKALIPDGEKTVLQDQMLDFIQNLPDELKDKIEDGALMITIESGCSPEKIHPSGVESGKGIVKNNYELATKRAETGKEDIVTPSLVAYGINPDNVTIKLIVPEGNADWEDGVNPNNPVRYTKVSFEVKTTIVEQPKVPKKPGVLNFDDYHDILVLADGSESMKDNITNTLNEVEESQDTLRAKGVSPTSNVMFFSQNTSPKYSVDTSATAVADLVNRLEDLEAAGTLGSNYEESQNALETALASMTAMPNKQLLLYLSDEGFQGASQHSLIESYREATAKNIDVRIRMINRETGNTKDFTLRELIGEVTEIIDDGRMRISSFPESRTPVNLDIQTDPRAPRPSAPGPIYNIN